MKAELRVNCKNKIVGNLTYSNLYDKPRIS